MGKYEQLFLSLTSGQMVRKIKPLQKDDILMGFTCQGQEPSFDCCPFIILAEFPVLEYGAVLGNSENVRGLGLRKLANSGLLPQTRR